jgi:hypothetical protein
MRTTNDTLVSWALEPDQKTVKVTFATSPPTMFQLDVAGVEKILENLGKLRSLMQPTIPADHAVGQKVTAVPDPRWVAELDVMRGDSLLHIRDPRYGWLHYLLPRREAGKLASTLQAQANAPPAETASGKPN